MTPDGVIQPEVLGKERDMTLRLPARLWVTLAMMKEEISVNEVEAMKSGGQETAQVEEEMSVTKVQERTEQIEQL